MEELVKDRLGDRLVNFSSSLLNEVDEQVEVCSSSLKETLNFGLVLFVVFSGKFLFFVDNILVERWFRSMGLLCLT